ncbi:glycosyl transferase family 1 [Yeosuana aromativorans]|uniref:Glycosyl transferase family 1 n=1 Tax=Yeosuana aromativorans TaxID=288019 RepID=A0A8J3BMQ8_9FLAO|nr:glycosyltransferase [Yeosuana aromativorans]GGK25568.1 glycosyl transferase family 1 [Yeosuana aromativorans]
MKILMVGEYSRLHNSLKEGLLKLNHSVTLIGNGDNFKKYPVDINIDATFFRKRIPFLIAKALHKIVKFSLVEMECAYKFYKILPELKDYDVVQLINENSLKTSPKLEIWLLKKFFKQNKKIFLLSCGVDYLSVKYAAEKKFKYSILTPLQHNPKLKKKYAFILKYLKKSFYKLHVFLYKNVEGVIASDLDYHIPLLNNKKYLGLIPNPINTDKIHYIKNNFNSKIKIFHGINRLNYIKKGNVFFEEALEIIQKKYPDKVEIITAENMPYNHYIKHYESCHILLDQVYAYDQGYNALEAMAKGKVVFTGAEQDWLEYYNLEENSVAINALPDSQDIAKKLEWLILNSNEIETISKNARLFIEREHNYINIAKRYLDTWNK